MTNRTREIAKQLITLSKAIPRPTGQTPDEIVESILEPFGTEAEAFHGLLNSLSTDEQRTLQALCYYGRAVREGSKPDLQAIYDSLNLDHMPDTIARNIWALEVALTDR